MEERVWHRHYDDGIPASIDYEELPVPAFLERAAERHPDATALIFQNARISYGKLWEDVRSMAAAMSALGVDPGTRVAIQLPTMPQTVIAYYAALLLGGQVVLTNPLYTPREIEHQWRDADCKLAVTTDFLWEKTVSTIVDDLPVEHTIVASIPEYLSFPINLLAPFKLKKADPPLWAKVQYGPKVHAFRKLVKRTPPSPPSPSLDLDEIAVLQYTGGTTGVSKGAVLTHRNLSFNVQQCAVWFGEGRPATDVVMICLPLFHVFGMTVGMNFAVHRAAAMVLAPNPRDHRAVVEQIAKHRVTIFPGVPALYNALNSYPGIEGMDVSSLKGCLSGSAPIPVDVLERFEQLTGATIVEGFGMSETSPVTHVNPLLGNRKVGTVGIPVPDTDARIVDVDDPKVVMPVGQEGELVVRGPQVMREYWNRPDETEKTLIDGWLHTGDLAVVDDDGYFKIVGRKKDMINCSGLKVFPDEVDAVLMAHDSILEAATIGIPHDTRGETVKSFIVLQPGVNMTAEDVDAYARENLAAYKVPREVEFIDELPKSTVLKVLRRELRDREIAKRQG